MIQMTSADHDGPGEVKIVGFMILSTLLLGELALAIHAATFYDPHDVLGNMNLMLANESIVITQLALWNTCTKSAHNALLVLILLFFRISHYLEAYQQICMVLDPTDSDWSFSGRAQSMHTWCCAEALLLTRR